MGVLLSNSLSSVTSLHAQILVSKGTDTSFEVAAFSESMTIGNALAPWASNGHRWIGAGAAEFLTAVDELDFLPFDYQQDAVRVFRNGVDPLDL